MKTLSLAIALAACLSAGQAQANEPERLPFHALTCETINALEGSEFDAENATIILSVPFNITNSDRRLKFYRSMIAFGDTKAFQIVQSRVTQDDMSDKSGRFGNLKDRQKDDDIPTGFLSDGVEYELQTVTGFKVTERTGENTFKINQDAPIRVKLEAITNSSEREPPVWVGECTKTGLFAPQ